VVGKSLFFLFKMLNILSCFTILKEEGVVNNN
jgi:hypothetical protein